VSKFLGSATGVYKWPRYRMGRMIEWWLCDGSVMLEGLEALIESFFEVIV
jgi:hypothetical protein